jgi:3-deoxy-7-phosphoheptulonate synthase
MKTYDVRVKDYMSLIPPAALKTELPIPETAARAVVESRQIIEGILARQDHRLLVITGPCSIHDTSAALDYAERLKSLAVKVQDTLYLVMRVYFEKPRTTVGWKGLISDPHLNGSYDMMEGLRRARQLLLDIVEMGLPTATEMLDPITPQYIAGLVCWSAIGARTTESQTHREMASGLSMPVGFKNCTDGGLDHAVNAIIAAGSPQHFLGIDQQGRTSVIRTTGNPATHVVLRGGRRPNYDSVSIREAVDQLREKGLADTLLVDCSHANSHKRFDEQVLVWKDVLAQRINGNEAIIGMMLESNLEEGRQDIGDDPQALRYGVSITDACISWETTEQLIMDAHRQLQSASETPEATTAAVGN